MTVIHLTDCTLVAAAIEKGSKGSAVLQTVAVQLFRLAATWAMHIESMWISGDEMILWGGDSLSLEATIDSHDTRVTDSTW